MATKVRTTNRALALAKKKWRDQAVVRDKGPASATTPESRAEARARLVAWQDRKPPRPVGRWADLPLDVRSAHNAAYRGWVAERDRLSSAARRMRYDVGHLVTFMGAFLIEGSGDTWEEALVKAGVPLEG